MYGTLKFIHILGVALLIGNVTASAVWKVFANRTNSAPVVAFAQKLVTYTDWTLTLSGVCMLAVGGYGMAWAAGLDLRAGWLRWGQLLFFVSGVVWLLRLVPIQILQARLAQKLIGNAEISAEYRLLSHSWIVWGVVATVPLVAATYLMVMKF